MLKKILLTITILYSIYSVALAQKKIKYDGFFELVLKGEYNDIYVRSFYTTKLEFNIQLDENTKIEIDTRANSKYRNVELYEASASINISNFVSIDVGDIKKKFGFEEWFSREKLHTIKRSMINRFLEPAGYVNREPGIHINYEDNRSSLCSGLHYNESHNFTFLLKGHKNKLVGLNTVFFNFQYIHRKDEPIPNSFAINAGFKDSLKYFYNEVEFFYGLNPIETYYSRVCNEKYNIYFAGVRTIINNKYYLKNFFITYIEPLILSSFLINNIENSDVNKIEILIGLNLYFNNNIRVMFNGDLILSNNEYNKNKRSLADSNIIMQLQIRW